MTTTSNAPTAVSPTNLADLSTVSKATTEALAAMVSGQTSVELPQEALEAMAKLLRLNSSKEEVSVASSFVVVPATTPNCHGAVLLDPDNLSPADRSTAPLKSAKNADHQQSPSSTAPQVQGFSIKVDDHTFFYRVVGPSTPQTQEDLIRQKLGTAAESLITSLKAIGVDVLANVPRVSEATLDTDSNNKSRLDQKQLYRHPGDWDRHKESLANPVQAIVIVIEAIYEAKRAEIDLKSQENDGTFIEKGQRIKAAALAAGLGEGTAAILEKLTSGEIRIAGGEGACNLYIENNGRLYLHDLIGINSGIHPRQWAFGAPLLRYKSWTQEGDGRAILSLAKEEELGLLRIPRVR